MFCFCKDNANTIRRCIDSVLGQTYANFEFVIQDGASTDGTLEILRGYKDPRIKVVSERDSGPAEGFWKAIRRCRGDIIASCLADEELLPNAVGEAVEILAKFPRLGAITRDGFVTDANGAIQSEFIAGEFDFVDYLFGRYCPMWCASFFRRAALLEVGLESEDWTIGCLEFEIWCRLATRHTVRYVPGIVAKYSVNSTQLSNSPRHINEHLDSRTKVIEAMFSEQGFFGDDKIKKIGCLYNQHFLFYNHARAYGLVDVMRTIYERVLEVEKGVGLASAQYATVFSRSQASLENTAASYSKAWELWRRYSVWVPSSIKRCLTAGQRTALREIGMRVLSALYGMASRAKSRPKWAGDPPPADDDLYGLSARVYSKRIYHETAVLYYGRGNIDYALFLWRKAEALNDPEIDGLAVQAALLSPSATNESLLADQRRWADRHAKPIAGLVPLQVRPYREDRPIRVGYYCAFLDSYVFRAMFSSVVRNHDRRKVEPMGYCATTCATDLKADFDEFRVTGTMADDKFVELIRSDHIDILVEMTGFSPMNRFSAMASRCAPIQIAHFNHSGTCGVQNVDYVFADAMSVEPADEKYYSERVWRLEGDFLLFNYDWASLPEPSEPPLLRNGHVTFACFASPGKFSDELIELWALILHQLPGSILYVRNAPLGRKVNRDYMAQRFSRHGIPASRLRLEGAAEWSEFIKSYEEVDISFDTWPYCGANTVGESLWQGVPVITLRGSRFSSRYGSSHLAAAGCPELIADSPEQYVRIAAELGASPDRLSHYRRNLRQMTRDHGLSDPQRFARKLEKAYAEMMRKLDAALQ